ncbi:MAG TPA: FAD-dependent oxidoreductase, partial [Methylomirabilota bacterium]|nr:FAD-dependent oxidoreductase [Methylomirabilota bacterium]
MATPSVAVVGGGIIGCATATDLAKRGCRVTLFERASPGAEASSAAAGLLAPLGPVPEPGPFHRLAIESWRRYPGVASELRELTGVDVELMTAGTLYPLHSDREIEAARLRLTWPLAGEFGIEVAEGSDLRALEPALSKDVRAARLVRGDHWVNNQRLVTAYAAAAAARGVTVHTGAEVSRLLI